jgi:NAD(P)-dependent dehydrogenase (short-subunit alcohol dehydrogenase family)
MQPLDGKIAVVAGATRGAGRGIARMLGAAGATVYCTGRSVRGRLASGPKRPETIEETAELVTDDGGMGIHAQVDHTRPEQVEQLFARVRSEQGRLDILVNDVWGGDALTEWGKMFWQLDPSIGLTMFERAVHSHIITSRYGVPLMLEGGPGLIVEITDGTAQRYRGHLFYDLVKVSVIRLAFAMSAELKDTHTTAVALTPGFLRSEAMLDHFGVSEETWRDAIAKDPYFEESETPFFVGRAVAALAADPAVGEKSGQALAVWNLAPEYGFTDVDGRQPNLSERIVDVVTRAVLSLIDMGRVPPLREASNPASIAHHQTAPRAASSQCQRRHVSRSYRAGARAR